MVKQENEYKEEEDDDGVWEQLDHAKIQQPCSIN